MEKIINKARNLRINQEHPAFLLDIPRMKFNKAIIFDTFQNYAKLTGVPPTVFEQIKDGCTIIRGDTHIVLTHTQTVAPLNKRNAAHISASPKRTSDLTGRKNWTLAHEVGHIMLGHTSDGEQEERQANCFAAELLMPELIMLELERRLARPLSVHEVRRLFGVSQTAAENRIAQIRRKTRFSIYLKQEFAEKYKQLINDYVKKHHNQKLKQQSILVEC